MAPRQPASDGGPDDAEGAVASPLSRLTNPLDLVVLTRDLVQAAVDDAVERGRMTRDDATELTVSLVAAGRRQAQDLISDLQRLVDAPAGGAGPGLPIAGYDELTAAQVSPRLADLVPAELRTVRDHERRNANRKTVLQAIEHKLGR